MSNARAQSLTNPATSQIQTKKSHRALCSSPQNLPHSNLHHGHLRRYHHFRPHRHPPPDRARRDAPARARAGRRSPRRPYRVLAVCAAQRRVARPCAQVVALAQLAPLVVGLNYRSISTSKRDNTHFLGLTLFFRRPVRPLPPLDPRARTPRPDTQNWPLVFPLLPFASSMLFIVTQTTPSKPSLFWFVEPRVEILPGPAARDVAPRPLSLKRATPPALFPVQQTPLLSAPPYVQIPREKKQNTVIQITEKSIISDPHREKVFKPLPTPTTPRATRRRRRVRAPQAAPPSWARAAPRAPTRSAPACSARAS